MSTSSSRASDFFVAGGTLRPNTPSYVERPADNELFDLALAGEFCYVLTPRQMGKSSLMIRTAQRLSKRKIHTVKIDLTEIGLVEIDAWYLGLLTELTRALKLSVDPETWWQERASLGQVQRFISFLRGIILTEVKGQIVIFIDEIDTTLNLDFRDDFFAAIRAMYNARAREPEFDRLTFILLGVASPPDLIRDHARTPFNIGQAITLQDFSQADTVVLQAGLEAIYPDQSKTIFNRIYYWTNGHPYLTQKLCQVVATASDEIWTDQRIDELVEKLFLTREVTKEANLKFVRDTILNHPQHREMLKIYRKVYKGKPIAPNEQLSTHNQLNLSGLVKVENERLHLRNEVYRRVFNWDWIKANTQRDWRLIGAYTGFIVAALAFIVSGIILWHDFFYIPNLAQEAMKYDFRHTTTTPMERVNRLATLFEPHYFLGQQDYHYEAQELFFNLQTSQEQLALFDVKSDKIVVIIKGLYVTLADVDNSNHTSPLLQKMIGSLEKLDETEEVKRLKDEIGSWVGGRDSAKQNEFNAARIKYDEAIDLNGENPAVLYERARVLVELAQYPQALSDLDQIMAIAGRVPSPTATVSPTMSQTLLLATPTLTDTVASTPTSTPKSTKTPLTTPFPFTRTVTETLQPNTTSTSVPTATPKPLSITSNFATTGQIENAVRSLINSQI